MNTQTQTDKATARPWKVFQDDDFLYPPVQITNANGFAIAKMAIRHEEVDNTNAALIVRAVNEYDAHCEMARDMERMKAVLETALTWEDLPMLVTQKIRHVSKQIEKSLAALSAIRNP